MTTIVPGCSNPAENTHILFGDGDSGFISTFELKKTTGIDMRYKCKEFKNFLQIDITDGLMYYQAIPGISSNGSYGNGSSRYDNNALIFSSHFDKCVGYDDGIDRSKTKIRFGRGAKEVTQDLDITHTGIMKLERISLITEYENVEPSAFVLTREEDTKCPICIEDLSGSAVSCHNRHQTCRSCVDRLAHKICPTCRVPYANFQLEPADRVMKRTYFKPTIHTGNILNDHIYREAQFVGMINRGCCHASNFKERVIITSFLHYYINLPERFTKSHTLLMEGGIFDFSQLRQYNDFPAGWFKFADYIRSPQYPEDAKSLLQIDINNRYYSDAEFKNDIERLYGATRAFHMEKGHVNKIHELKRFIYLMVNIMSMDADDILTYVKRFLERLTNISVSHFITKV
jgi:hypothetical protein